jgi:hypothetical protein
MYVISYFFLYDIINDIMYDIINVVLYHWFCMISYYSYMKVCQTLLTWQDSAWYHSCKMISYYHVLYHGSWMPSWKTTWSPATVANDSFGHSAASSGSGSTTEEVQRHNSIPLTWQQVTAFGERTVRYWCFMCYDIIYDIICDIGYDILLCAGLCGVTGALVHQPKPLMVVSPGKMTTSIFYMSWNDIIVEIINYAERGPSCVLVLE